MRILVCHSIADPWKPALNQLERTCDELRRRGHVVLIHDSTMSWDAEREADRFDAAEQSEQSGELVTCRGRGDQHSDRIGVRGALPFIAHLARSHFNHQQWQWNDRRALREFVPDVVLLRHESCYRSALSTAWRARVPVVAYVEGPDMCQRRVETEALPRSVRRSSWRWEGMSAWSERQAIRRYASILCESELVARSLSQFGLRTPVHVVRPSIDANSFPPLSPQDRLLYKRQIGLKRDVILGFYGSLRSVDTASRLASLMLWSTKFANTQWMLIADGEFLPQLRRAIEGKVDAVVMGPRHPRSLGRWLPLVDIAIDPEFGGDVSVPRATWPLLASAAAGSAIIAGDYRDVAAQLPNYQTAELVADDRLTTWTHSLARLVLDEPRRRALGTQARAHVLQHNETAITVSTIEASLNAILGQRSAKGLEESTTGPRKPELQTRFLAHRPRAATIGDTLATSCSQTTVEHSASLERSFEPPGEKATVAHK